MVRRLLIAVALAACDPNLPSKIPCQTNDNCPYGLGCNLTARVCVEVLGCGDNNGGGPCFYGSPMSPGVVLNGSGATVTWSPGNTPNNASGFAVLRATAQAGPYAVVGTVTPYTTQQSSFNDPGPLAPGTTYWYEVATSWPQNVVGTPSPATSLMVPHWMPRAPMFTSRYGLAAATINGVIYAVGGYSTSTSLTTLEAYDPVADTWSSKADMPTARAYLGAGVVNGSLYAVGGGCNCSGGPASVTTLEAYDPVAGTWSSNAPMPTARSDLAAAVVNGVLYAVGGSGSGSTVEAYDPGSNTWSAKAPLPTARYDLAAAVVGGLIYAVGGVDSRANRLATVEAYDPVANTWTTKANMPTPRQGPAVGVVGGILYVVGGTSGFGAYTVVEAYDPVANSWSTKDPMREARAFPGVAVAGGLLFVMGGYGQTGPGLSSLEAFTP